MKLSFIGADHEVTGSCHMLTVCGKHILIDCGMQQGRDEFVNQDIPESPAAIDYVLLTHAHIDHAGLLPMLTAQGFKGGIYCTGATAELCSIMLRDSAHIQESEAEWKSRKARRSGGEEGVPLYTMSDAEATLRLFVPCDYDKEFELCEGVRLRFSDVGHLLGSASIECTLTENGITRTVVFSGDIGNTDRPLINDPTYIEKADYVVMESTYGDRDHPDSSVDYVRELADIINDTFRRGGNVVIPSFAVGRTQEMLYYIRKIKADGLVKGFGDFKVVVDSPLAVQATEIFVKNAARYFDPDAQELIRQGQNPIRFPGLTFSQTSDESKLINFDSTPKVIISASGMCEAGRIRHHLKHNLWRPESTVLFVGYQAEGSLGRKLLEGAPSVKLFGESIEVRATIKRLDGISGHADRKGLLSWLTAIKKKPSRVFIVHGEDTVCESFRELLSEQYGYAADAPYSGAVYDLAADCWLEKGERMPVKRPDKSARRASSAFDKLLAAGKRLLVVIERNKGGANKDLARLTSQITSLCDKWDK